MSLHHHGHSQSLTFPHVTHGNAWSITVTPGTKYDHCSCTTRFGPGLSTKLPPMSMHHHSHSHSLKVTQGHSRSFMFTQSHSWYEVMTNVSAPPGFDLGHSIKLPPMSLHPNGHSKSLMVTHGHSRSLMVQSYDQCLCTTGVQSRSQ